MTTSNFNIRLDDDLKARAFAVIERFGLTPTQAMRMFLTQIAETDSVIINHHSFIFHQQNPYLQHEKAIVIPFHRLDRV